MKNFNAEEARKLTNAYINRALESALETIRYSAKNGNTTAEIYDPLRHEIVVELDKRGFVVTETDQEMFDKTNCYYIVSWFSKEEE